MLATPTLTVDELRLPIGAAPRGTSRRPLTALASASLRHVGVLPALRRLLATALLGLTFTLGACEDRIEVEESFDSMLTQQSKAFRADDIGLFVDTIGRAAVVDVSGIPRAHNQVDAKRVLRALRGATSGQFDASTREVAIFSEVAYAWGDLDLGMLQDGSATAQGFYVVIGERGERGAWETWQFLTNPDLHVPDGLSWPKPPAVRPLIDNTSVGRLLESLADSVRDGNRERAALCFAPDGTLLPGGDTIVEGRKAAADYVFDWLGEGCAPEFVLERIRLTAEGTIIASGSFHTVPRREGFLNSDGSGCDKHAPQRFLLIAARSDRLEMSTAISRWFWAEGR